MYDLIVIGGGAAGIFTAISLKERRPEARVLVLEKSDKLLAKVKVSGGGRCNVTHACFDPHEMVENYPRGNKELLGPFHRFLCGDMMEWLSERGVETKIEDDGRVFPITNSSQSIIDCFLTACSKHKIKIIKKCALKDIQKKNGTWSLDTLCGTYESGQVMIATGSSPSMWKMLKGMGLPMIEPVPSLFTFNTKDKLTEGLQGLSMPATQISIIGTRFIDSGPTLITHWGLSGPAVLKLSAWAARELSEIKYDFQIKINWLGLDASEVKEQFDYLRSVHAKRVVKNYPQFGIPRRFWERFCYMARLHDVKWASASKNQVIDLIQLLCDHQMNVKGKSTFKEEFVTCGGVDRKEIDFKTMQSRSYSGLYFAGEVIDIDAVTGGFNFQAAWTESYIAAEHLSTQF